MGPHGLILESKAYEKSLQHTKELPESSAHSMILICIHDEAFLIQAYQECYSMREWLDFGNDLRPAPGLNPEDKIDPTPFYRGIMDREKRNSFCKDVESLSKKINHDKVYEKITGIKLGSKHHSLEMRHDIAFFRLDLTRLIYPTDEIC